MHEMLSFMVSVAAGVTSNLISKWLDRMLNKDCKTKKKTPSLERQLQEGVFFFWCEFYARIHCLSVFIICDRAEKSSIHFKITSPFSASTVRLPPAFRCRR